MGQILARQEEGQDSRRRTISFSSEAPYRRYFGMEILDHAEGAVDLGRLNSVGVLLFNHDVDKVVGRVIRAWLENNRGMEGLRRRTPVRHRTAAPPAGR